MRFRLFVLAMLVSAASATATGNGLEKPFRVTAGGKAITVDAGHAAPFVGDFDGDGVKDLLVGQFGSGRLRIYRNVGTNEEPKFDGFEWFQAGATIATVPAG